jgi:hypothetical protein
MLRRMETSANKRLSIAYIVAASVFALMMFFSASFKLMLHPGAVRGIHEVVGVPLVYFPVLAGLEIAGGLGLLAGIIRPRLGVAGAIGLVLYFIGAILAHVRVGDWDGLKSPIFPLLFAVAVLTLRVVSLRRPVESTNTLRSA